MLTALKMPLLGLMRPSHVKPLFLVALLGLSLALGSMVALRTGSEKISSLNDCLVLPHGPAARDCYVRVLEFDDEGSLYERLATVEKLMLDPTQRHFQIECHEVTHQLGKTAASIVEEYQKLYTATEDDACMGGFQHGLLEAELASMTDAELASAGQSVCEGKLREFNRCVHLLGHIAVQRSELAETGIELARKMCGNKPVHLTYDSAFHEFRCYDGAYMEITLRMRRTPGQGGLDLSNRPAEEYCVSLRTDYDRVVESSACMHQVSTILVSESGNTPETFERCTRLITTVSAAFSELCTLASASFMSVTSDDPVNLSPRVCTGLGQSMRACFAGFARSYGNMSGLSAAEDFCQMVSSNDVDGCLDVSTPFEYNSPVGVVSALDMVPDTAEPSKTG